MDIKRQGNKTHPWEKAGFISRLAFWWTIPIFKLGWKKELGEDDLDDCPLNERSDKLGDKLESEWIKEKQLQKNGKTKKASLRRAVINAFGTHYLLRGLLVLLLECGIRIGQPICLGWLIRYVSNPDSMSDMKGYWSAAGVCILGFMGTLLYHPVAVGLMLDGMRVKVSSGTLIYRKSLKLSQMAMGQTTVGQMVNLLSNDVSRFDMSALFLPYLIIGPTQTVVVIALLWQYLGYSCLFGLLVLILFIPFQTYMGKLFSKLRASTAVLTDERVRLMNEIVAGMRVIKMYTWEHPFAKMVDLARRNEVGQIKKSSILKGLNIAVFFGASKIIVFVCFVAYILLGNSLTAEVVFVSMSLYDYLRLTMTFFFPLAISCWAESTISLSRIQDFLELEEQAHTSGMTVVDARETCAVSLMSVSAKWNEKSAELNLDNISVKINPGVLLAIVGPVGSGKSSLLMSILGELPITSGDIKRNGRIGYSSQEPWVFGGTIQQNILFGQPMDRMKYDRVLNVCELNRDIGILPYGDQTLVGERGVSLSGGQKARVNLARAIYMDADVYLLDDPLSAVDVTVAKQLFERCIEDHLKDKARVLVTHQIQFLKNVDRIMILKQGKCLAVGSYEDLISHGYDLMSMVDLVPSLEADESESKLLENEVPSFHLSESGDSFSINKEYDEIIDMQDLLIDATNKLKETGTQKQVKEQKAEGSVKASTYFKYLNAGGGIFLLIFVVLANLSTQFVYSYCDFWLSLWTKAEEEKLFLRSSSNDTDEFKNATTSVSSGISWNSITGDFSDTYSNIYTYGALMGTLFALSITRTVTFFLICMRASVKLHNEMFKSVSRAPISFFDNNPVGRILNRFTKDLGLIDDQLPFTLVDFTANVLTLLAIIGIVMYVSPLTSVPTLVLILIFIMIRKFYIATARDLKRLEGTTRSPVFSHLSTSLNGITTIRSSGVEKQFEIDFCSLQDNHTSTWFTLLGIARWFASMLDQLTILYITCLTIFLMTVDSGTTGGNVGLSLSNALALIGLFQYAVNQSADLENQMTGVERVIEYTKLSPEADLDSTPDKKPPLDWPKQGEILLKNVSLIYSESGNVAVLKGLNCKIKGGEKVGIVGRTGAGKSSVISALFRMTEPDGLLIIDGVNIKDIGLHDLRRKISIIPQDPVLFSNSVRKNLDPFNSKSDDELWEVLDEVQLKDAVKDMPGGLDHHVSEGGGNLSVGQRQLFCLARALLRNNQILVLDEATANVDHNTDSLIQKTIRKKFGHCTVLTVAHRLNTVMDSDKIMVLDAGKIVEFDKPSRLLKQRDSLLSVMINETGPMMAKQLFDIARDAKTTKYLGK